jgi:sRNA-binding carbon storage regulator CsrA
MSKKGKQGFLCITRKIGQSLFVGDVEICISKRNKDGVVIAVRADPSVRIVRGEAKKDTVVAFDKEPA